jgi:hypothetical protein
MNSRKSRVFYAMVEADLKPAQSGSTSASRMGTAQTARCNTAFSAGLEGEDQTFGRSLKERVQIF